MSEHTTVLPELPPQPERRRSLGLVAVIASAVVVVLVAVGGFAAWRLLAGGGPRPAEVLPASTFALVTVDLDPSGGQKVEAIKTLRKFPSFRDRSGLEPESDPLKRLFDGVQDEGNCQELDYERDIKSWMGQRAGVGGVLLDGKPVPVAALQVSDPENAEPGYTRFAECSELEDFGWTLVEDYIVISDSTAHAKTIAARGKEAPLSEDAAFQKWTDEAGGPGIVNAYVGRSAVDVASDQLGSGLGDLDDLGGLGGHRGGDEPGGSSGEEDAADALAAYKDFKGAAAVLRFAGGGIELSLAGGGGKTTAGKETVGEHVESMPADTALLFALAVPSGAFESFEKADPDGAGSDFLSDILGIDVPDDLRTLLGKSLSISLGGDAPDDLATIEGLGDLSVGALIRGDTDEIEAVIEKLEQSSGTTLADLQVTRTSKDGKVAIASTSDYADQLLGSGSLADDEGFEDAVPNPGDSQFVLYGDVDGAWGEAVLDLLRENGDAESEEVADNLAVVRAFGASAWTDGDVSHGLVRLSLK